MRYFILKEFLKFKLAFYFFVSCSLFCVAWIWLDLKDSIHKYSITGYTMQLMFNKNFSYNHLDELNLLFALIIGVSSMFFERQNARIRLQLHYPQSYLKNVLLLSLTPFCFLLGVYLVQIILLFAVFSSFFDTLIANALISTLIYNVIFSLGLFLLTQSVVIEPNLGRVLGSIIVGIGGVFIYFSINPDVGKSPLFYLNDNALIYLIFWVFFSICLLVSSLQNYKRGYIK